MGDIEDQKASLPNDEEEGQEEEKDKGKDKAKGDSGPGSQPVDDAVAARERKLRKQQEKFERAQAIHQSRFDQGESETSGTGKGAGPSGEVNKGAGSSGGADKRAGGAGEDAELVRLRGELAQAEIVLQAAQHDVDHPTWGRWVKYMFVTASGKASSAEIATFIGFRGGLCYALTAVLAAVSSAVPGALYSDVLHRDMSATNSTDTTELTDAANVAYYWGNFATFGSQALAGVTVSLTSIASYYKAMRERVLQEAKAERDKLLDRVAQREGLVQLLRAEEENHRVLVGVHEGAQAHAGRLESQNEDLKAKLLRARKTIKKLNADIAALAEQNAETQANIEALEAGGEELEEMEGVVNAAISQTEALADSPPPLEDATEK